MYMAVIKQEEGGIFWLPRIEVFFKLKEPLVLQCNNQNMALGYTGVYDSGNDTREGGTVHFWLPWRKVFSFSNY